MACTSLGRGTAAKEMPEAQVPSASTAGRLGWLPWAVAAVREGELPAPWSSPRGPDSHEPGPGWLAGATPCAPWTHLSCPAQCLRVEVVGLQSWTPRLGPWAPSPPHLTCPRLPSWMCPRTCKLLDAQGGRSAPAAQTWPTSPAQWGLLVPRTMWPHPVHQDGSGPGQQGALCRDRELQKARVPSQCSPRSWGVCLPCRLCILAREPTLRISGSCFHQKHQVKRKVQVAGEGWQGSQKGAHGGGGQVRGTLGGVPQAVQSPGGGLGQPCPPRQPYHSRSCTLRCPQTGLLPCSPDHPYPTPRRALGMPRCERSKCLLILQPLAGRRL